MYHGYSGACETANLIVSQHGMLMVTGIHVIDSASDEKGY